MDYKKKYDQALNDMRAIYPNLKGDAKLAVEHAFPELRESEDERIRNEILIYIGAKQDIDLDTHNRWCNWLEKQKKCVADSSKTLAGEDEKAKRMLNAITYKMSQYQPDIFTEEENEWFNAYLEKQKEQKPKIIIPKFRIGEYIKPKPYNEKHLIKNINENGYVLDVDFVVPFKDEDVWEVAERKPEEWSEEDEKDMAHIIRILDDCYAYGKHDLSKTDHENFVNKLKSLRPSWEPSEEQMNALQCAIVFMEIRKASDYDITPLKSLYEQLKKLM